MTRTHRDDLERFMSEYHRRSIIEAVFGAIKKMYGNHLRAGGSPGRNGRRPSGSSATTEVVARSHVKNGRLTHESLAALAA